MNLERTVPLISAIDRRLAALAEAGRAAPHQTCDGEEAVLAGTAAALTDRDWVFWGRQVNAAALARGLGPKDLFVHALRGDPAALCERRIVTDSHGAAARLAHATGLGWAARRDRVVAVCELGDGAVDDGDFHVGVNFAAVMCAPVVFVIRNGSGRPMAARARGYGMAAAAVDGRDAVAVRDAVREAMERGRRGEGPTLVDAAVTRGRTVAPEGAIVGQDAAVEAALAAAEREAGL